MHLYTGRDLDGSTAGIAFREALCSRRFGVGLSEGRRNLATDALIAAHELGHNFGAPHDGDPDEACASTPETFLMAPSINGSSTFSDCSLNEIQRHVASASCLTAVEPIDVLPILVGFPSGDVVVGTDFDGTVRVRNNGGSDASAIVTVVEPPVEAPVVATSLPTGCVPSGANVECTIATLAAGAETDLAFRFSADAAGIVTVSATTSTSGDGNTSNDTATRNVELVTEIDLAAGISVPSALTLGDTATARAEVTNLSAHDASNVRVTVNAGNRLTINDAPSACTFSGADAVCTIASLASGSTRFFDLTVEADAIGDGTVTATVLADQTDPVAGNDSASANVSVSDPASVEVDIGVTLSGDTEPDSGAGASYTATVTNSNAASASVVALSLTFPSILEVGVLPGACSGSAGSVTCELGDMPGGASSAITIDVDAVDSGSGTIEASVTTASNDTATGNDTSSLAVTVAAPPPPPPPPPPPGNTESSSGGGGSGGPILVALLGLLAGIRRRTQAVAK